MLNVKVLRPSKHYVPSGNNEFRTKKYESSGDDNASDEEDNLRTLFANLNMQQKEKPNELISAIHETVT